MLWLLTADAWQRVQEALASKATPTAEQAQAFAAATDVTAAAKDTPRNMRVAGSTAEIQVSGVLVPRASFLMWLFGIEQTEYRSIESALAIAEADPDVKDIVLSIDSPGGAVDGLFETFAAVENVRKPMSVRSGFAASAAYGLAAVAGPITATNAAATFGSVGVVASYVVDDDVVDITSTEAPDKRPDPSTDEGKAVIRKHLDAVHGLFADAIARGRDTTVETVNADFGRGAVLLAAEAKRRGMIDSYPKPKGRARATGTRATADQQEINNMDLNTLKAQHPALVEQLLAQGREEGTKAERRRCLDHMQLGDASGAAEQASEAIKAGTPVADMQATYLAAGMRRQHVAAAQADSDTAAGATGGAAATEPEEDLEDKTHDLVVEMLKGEAAHG